MPVKLFTIERFSSSDFGISTIMKAKKPNTKQVQAVRCPTCGAGPGEKCELSTGQPRTEPHRFWNLVAKGGFTKREIGIIGKIRVPTRTVWWWRSHAGCGFNLSTMCLL